MCSVTFGAFPVQCSFLISAVHCVNCNIVHLFNTLYKSCCMITVIYIHFFICGIFLLCRWMVCSIRLLTLGFLFVLQIVNAIQDTVYVGLHDQHSTYLLLPSAPDRFDPNRMEEMFWSAQIIFLTHAVIAQCLSCGKLQWAPFAECWAVFTNCWFLKAFTVKMQPLIIHTFTQHGNKNGIFNPMTNYTKYTTLSSQFSYKAFSVPS